LKNSRISPFEVEMKKFNLLLYPMMALVIFLGFGINSLADGHENLALVNKTIYEPISILVIGLGLIAVGSFLKRSSR
jgi:hypothetical protein